MASVTPEKELTVKELGDNFVNCQAAYLVDYKGCTCADLTGLRRKLRPVGADFAVVKNTMAQLAVSGTDLSKLEDWLAGPTAIIWAKNDPVAPAKVLKDFGKDRENFSIKGGVVDGSVVSASDVQQLADLPSKEQLLSQLLRTINAPAVQLLRTINAPAQQLASLLNAWKDKLGEKQQ